MGDFHGTGIKIWAGFQPVGNTEKWFGPIMKTFGGFFFIFSGTKKNIFSKKNIGAFAKVIYTKYSRH